MWQSSIFQWKYGAGWLILTSSEDDQSEQRDAILTRMLNRSAADGPLIYIGAAHDQEKSEQAINYLADLGSRSGFILDIISEDDETLRQQLGEAGIIVIGDGPDRGRLGNGLQGAAISGIEQAYVNGAVIMCTGCVAELFGRWVLPTNERAAPTQGFSWIEQAAILAGKIGTGEKEALQGLLQAQPTAYGLTILPGSALVFGPDNQVEVWGNRQIAISLGKAYTIQE